MKKTWIIECPTNLGLAKIPGIDQPGVYKLPGWLNQLGLYQRIEPEKIVQIPAPPYKDQLDEISGIKNADELRAYAIQQSNTIRNVLSSSAIPLVIGGDCSILIGNCIALKQQGHYGLFFLDGHTDFGWSSISSSKAAAGMDLGIVTGNCHEKLSNINGLSPYISEPDAWAVGNRDFDQRYIEVMMKSAVNYFDIHTIRETGAGEITKSFLSAMESSGINGFWVHLDVDVLHDDLMPAVDSPQPGGLNYNELNELLLPLLSHAKFAGLEITILDPDLDPTGIYTKPFVESFVEIWKKAGL